MRATTPSPDEDPVDPSERRAAAPPDTFPQALSKATTKNDKSAKSLGT